MSPEGVCLSHLSRHPAPSFTGHLAKTYFKDFFGLSASHIEALCHTHSWLQAFTLGGQQTAATQYPPMHVATSVRLKGQKALGDPPSSQGTMLSPFICL